MKIQPETENNLLQEVEEFNIKPRNFNEIVTVLTFEDYDPMIFRFSRKTNDTVKKEREEFYGLNEKEQKDQTSNFRINQLSHLLLECPENVPGVENDGNWKTEFTKLITEDMEMRNWIWGQYQSKLYPKEVLLRFLD